MKRRKEGLPKKLIALNDTNMYQLERKATTQNPSALYLNEIAMYPT